MKFRLLAATALVVATSAYAADNMTVKDGTGATKVLAKKDVGSVLYDKNIVVLQSDVTIDAMAQIDGHVDGIESLLTTETANTSAISGKLPATLGSKTGATSLSVVPANDGFSVQCTSGCSGGTQYNEDVASANGDTGTIALAVRKATPANTSGTDGDYEALQISAGRLWTDAGALLPTSLGAKVGTGSLSVVPASDGFGVNASQTGTWNITNISGTVSLPTGAATAAKQPALGTAGSSSADVITVQGITGGTNLNVNCAAGCAGGTQYAEDAVAASGNSGTAALGVQVASPASTAADGDWTWSQYTGGKLHVIDLSANAVLGTTGDAAWTSGSGSVISLLKAIAGPAVDTNPVAVKTDQTTPGTTDLVHAAGFAGTATTTITRPADAAQYTAGDAFADSTSAPTTGGFTLSGMCRASGGSGVLTDATFIYSTSVAVAGIIYLYDSAPTAQNDNAAWSVSDSDQLKLVGTIPFTTVADGANAVHNVQNLNMGYTCVGSANLRYMVKITTTYTPASGDTLTVRAKYVQTN